MVQRTRSPGTNRDTGSQDRDEVEDNWGELTATQRDILRVLMDFHTSGEAATGREIIAELSETRSIHIQTVYTALDELAKKGFVCRERCDEDKRAKYFTITPTGQDQFRSYAERELKRLLRL